MNIEYVKSQSILLRDASKDEKWLQDLICQDPAVLGLGDVTVIQRERTQPTGGRIDLVLSDPEEDIRYEVEIMLGAIDASHIIRTIEYWDIERRRYPRHTHRAVIVAEEITNRFFNVIGLLNKAIPIIAIQLNAAMVESKLILNFNKVLDLVEEEEEEEAGEQVDRKYWESKANEKSLAIMDKIIVLIPKEAGEVRVKYNRGHIALGTSGTNFCWFHPRKSAHIHLHIEVGAESRDEIKKKLEEQGVQCRLHRADDLTVVLTMQEFEQNKELVKESISMAELQSRK